VAEMAVTLFSVNKGYFDDIPVAKALAFESALHSAMKSQQKSLMDTIESTKDLNADNEKLLAAAIEDFKKTAVY
jgi:F-type H+-transporting ATPase subunit alpha